MAYGYCRYPLSRGIDIREAQAFPFHVVLEGPLGKHVVNPLQKLP